MKKFLLPLYTLWFREVIRFLRQRNRVMGAIVQPLLFWLLLGFGFRSTFQYQATSGQVTYMQYFFPGILNLVLLFTALFATFSLIEDKKEGFLQGVLVAPVSRLSIVLGKITGGASIAVFQALLFLILAPLIGLKLDISQLIFMILVLSLIATSLTSFGFCIAWRMDSIQGFHAIMMLILMPMWFLSGAFFPETGLPYALKIIMKLNPLTYAVALIRHVFYLGQSQLSDLPSLSLSLIVVILFGALTLLLSTFLAKFQRKSW